MKLNKINKSWKKFQLLNQQDDPLQESGQSFIEFILLLLVLITFSMGMVNGFNNTIAKQWRALVKVISLPNNTNDFDL